VRIACLLVPDLPLAAELRAHPELRGTPLAIASGPGSRAEILAISPEATRGGVRPFTTVVQGRAACAELCVRVASPALERAARDALLDAALSASPRTEAAPLRSGIYAAEAAVYIDARGITSLFHSEPGFAGALIARAEKLGLPTVAAIASSRGVAHIAARRCAGTPGATEVLPPGGDAAFLAPLPIDLLNPEDELAESLTRFGIHRVRDLTRIPERALVTRLGGGARKLLALARGEESAHPIPTHSRTHFEESVDLEAPVSHLEPFLFLLRGMISRMVTRLECRALACGDLDVDLDLEGGQRDARRIGVASPTLDPRVLVRLAALSLESRPPPAPIERASLATTGSPVRSDQLDFFRPAGPTPAVLSRTLAELEALCGPGQIGAPVVSDSHRPDAYAMGAFAPSPSAGALARDGDAHAELSRGFLAVRALRPPVPAQVHASLGSPEWICSAVANGEVTRCAGPWRTTGGWWSREERFAFDHFDVQTSDGLVVRLRLDLITGCWQIDAVYD
jgi:protein ImuB